MNSGGAERVAATLCNALAQRGDQVTLVATYSGRGECHYPLSDQVQLLYLADLVRGATMQVLGYCARLFGLRRMIKQAAPDVVISFLTNVNITAVMATWGLKVPLIVCERTDPLAARDSPAIWAALRRLLYPLADIVTVQTESSVPKIRACAPGIRRVEVIANPIPEALFSVNKVVGSAQRRRLITVGRLSEEKQLDQLVDVFAVLAPRYPDLDLWMWGEGESRESLEKQIGRKGLAARVFLPGRTQAPWSEMLAGDVFVLTSACEGFPNVLLEAMALGLPCVSYDCPSGPREISEDGRVAVLVPLNDRVRLEHAISALLDDAEERARLGLLGAASVRARYRLHRVLESWDRLILEARSIRARGSA